MISEIQHFLLLTTLGLDKRVRPSHNHLAIGADTTREIVSAVNDLQKAGYLRFGYTEAGSDFYHCTTRGKAAAKLNYHELTALLDGDEGESD